MRPSDSPQVPAGDQPAPSQEAPFYAVVPLTFCPHLADHVKPVPSNGISAHGPCSSCQDASENWVCLNCYQVFCSRYVNGHMANHAQEQGHQVALSLADISVWCFACDFYVANEATRSAKQAAYFSKFGENYPEGGAAMVENGGLR